MSTEFSERSPALIAELLALFLLVPLALLLPVPAVWRIVLVLISIGYTIAVSVVAVSLKSASLYRLPSTISWRELLLRFLLLGGVLIGLIYILTPENLFLVVRENPGFWFGISVFYSLFSVYPQEWVYRHFFFHRYRSLFRHPRFLLVGNALIFCWAHIIFLNPWVLLLTFIGGLLFAHTYQRSRSLMLTSIEHAAYGIFLFTAGAGEMLAFPMP